MSIPKIDKLQEAVEVAKKMKNIVESKWTAPNAEDYRKPKGLLSKRKQRETLQTLLSLAQQVIDRQGKMPKKKEKIFDNEPYCKTCRRSETFCQCDGYNQALDDCSLAFAGQDNIFINHIQSHLKPNEEVICKICGKTAKEIINEKL